MKKLILVFAITLAAVSAQAGVELRALIYSSVCYDTEAQHLFDALKAAGAKTKVNGTVTTYNVTNIKTRTHWNTALDESAPCFNKPSYEVEFVDVNNSNARVVIDNANDCGETKAKAVVRAFGDIGGDKVVDSAMGSSYFVASDFEARHSTRQGELYPYYCSGTVGSNE
jgi:hypothetical protein